MLILLSLKSFSYCNANVFLVVIEENSRYCFGQLSNLITHRLVSYKYFGENCVKNNQVVLFHNIVTNMYGLEWFIGCLRNSVK